MLSDIHVALHLATLASTFNIVRSDYIFSTSLTCIIQFNLESISRAQHSHRSLVMGQLAIIDLARLMDACLANITGHNRAHYWPKLDAAMLTSQLLLRKCVCANRLIYSSEGAPVELWSRVACVCMCIVSLSHNNNQQSRPMRVNLPSMASNRERERLGLMHSYVCANGVSTDICSTRHPTPPQTICIEFHRSRNVPLSLRFTVQHSVALLIIMMLMMIVIRGSRENHFHSFAILIIFKWNIYTY